MSWRLLITFEKYKCAHARNSWRKQPHGFVGRCYDAFANIPNGALLLLIWFIVAHLWWTLHYIQKEPLDLWMIVWATIKWHSKLLMLETRKLSKLRMEDTWHTYSITKEIWLPQWQMKIYENEWDWWSGYIDQNLVF